MELKQRILPKGVLVAQFIEDANRMPDDQLSDKYDVSFRTLRRWKQKIRESEEDIAASVFPESPSPVYDDFLRLDYERLLVIGDLECPDHHQEFIESLMRVADRLGIEHILINGDMVAMDSFSSWPPIHRQSNDFERDLDIAIKGIKVFLGNFDTVDYLMGNHEHRINRQTKGHINIGLFCKHMLGLRCSDYSYCELSNSGKEVIICHPTEFSRVPLAVPRKLAMVHEKNVLVGHTHALEWGYSDSGKYWIASGGHCRSEERTQYIRMKMTSYPKWNLGASLIWKGEFYPIHPGNIDFWMNKVSALDR